MRLFVLGATGATGRHFVERALARGHEVTALGRSQLPAAPKLTSITGDPTSTEALLAMRGHDAVLNALGARDRKPTRICADSTKATLAAMEATAVRRLVVISSALHYPGLGVPGWIASRIFKNPIADSKEMESLLEASAVDWTITRPPRLTNGAARGSYRTSHGQAPPASSIARVDLAHALLDLVERSEHVREVVGISK